jgi:hypothetical protein
MAHSWWTINPFFKNEQHAPLSTLVSEVNKEEKKKKKKKKKNECFVDLNVSP